MYIYICVYTCLSSSPITLPGSACTIIKYKGVARFPNQNYWHGYVKDLYNCGVAMLPSNISKSRSLTIIWSHRMTSDPIAWHLFSPLSSLYPSQVTTAHLIASHVFRASRVSIVQSPPCPISYRHFSHSLKQLRLVSSPCIWSTRMSHLLNSSLLSRLPVTTAHLVSSHLISFVSLFVIIGPLHALKRRCVQEGVRKFPIRLIRFRVVSPLEYSNSSMQKRTLMTTDWKARPCHLPGDRGATVLWRFVDMSLGFGPIVGRLHLVGSLVEIG